MVFSSVATSSPNMAIERASACALLVDDLQPVDKVAVPPARSIRKARSSCCRRRGVDERIEQGGLPSLQSTVQDLHPLPEPAFEYQQQRIANDSILDLVAGEANGADLKDDALRHERQRDSLNPAEVRRGGMVAW